MSYDFDNRAPDAGYFDYTLNTATYGNGPVMVTTGIDPWSANGNFCITFEANLRMPVPKNRARPGYRTALSSRHRNREARPAIRASALPSQIPRAAPDLAPGTRSAPDAARARRRALAVRASL